jgi:hypothetical protein
MASLDELLAELSEASIVREVRTPSGNAREAFATCPQTVGDDQAFDRLIGDYYNHHLKECEGVTLSRSRSTGRAKRLLDQVYREGEGGLGQAAINAQNGNAYGMPRVLDTLRLGLEDEAVSDYRRNVIDRYVARTSFQEQVDIVAQLLPRLIAMGVPNLHADRPEEYAKDFERLILLYVEAGTRVAGSIQTI